MENKHFFGLMGNASEFLKDLTLIESTEGGWTQKYFDSRTKQFWLKYMIDRDKGYYYNLMLVSPKLTTEDIIEIAFSSADHDEVEGASHRLLLEENEEKKEFRQSVIDRLDKIDLSNIDAEEKKRIRTIIANGSLTDKLNKREIVGKHFLEIQADAIFFKSIAEKAEQILKYIAN